MPRVKTIDGCRLGHIDLSSFPNFSVTGSVRGMKHYYYGEDALLVRCGSWIYNVTSKPEIYYKEAH